MGGDEIFPYHLPPEARSDCVSSRISNPEELIQQLNEGLSDMVKDFTEQVSQLVIMKSNRLNPETLNKYLATDVKLSEPVFTQELHDELKKDGYDVKDECVVRKLSLDKALYMTGTQMSFHQNHLTLCNIDLGKKRGEQIFLPDFNRYTPEDIVSLEINNCKDELADARNFDKKLYLRHPGTVTYHVACQKLLRLDADKDFDTDLLSLLPWYEGDDLEFKEPSGKLKCQTMFLSKELHFAFTKMHSKNWLNRPKSDILRLFLQLHNLVLLNLITEDNDKIPENEALVLTHVFKCLFDTLGEDFRIAFTKAAARCGRLFKQSDRKDKGHKNNQTSANLSLKFFTVTHFRDTIVKNNNLDPTKFAFVDPIAAPAGTPFSTADSQMVTNLIVPAIAKALADQRAHFENMTKKVDGKIADLTSRISALTTALNHVTVTVNQIAAHTGAVANQNRDISAPTTPAPTAAEEDKEGPDDYNRAEEDFDGILSPPR